VNTDYAAPAAEASAAASACADHGRDCRDSRCCLRPGESCFRKDEEWAACRKGCRRGIDPDDLPQWRTPWSCELISDPSSSGPISNSALPVVSGSNSSSSNKQSVPSTAATAIVGPGNLFIRPASGPAVETTAGKPQVLGAGSSVQPVEPVSDAPALPGPGPPRFENKTGPADPVVVLDMFRAMRATEVEHYPVEDDDIADLGGVLKYVHTEAIMEHLLPPDRRERKYGLDCVTRHRFKIRNPKALLANEGFMVDFGQFVTYDYGVATNSAQRPMIQRFGDFVGVQDNRDPRYPSLEPYFWFSTGNRCPNLPWDKKGTHEDPNPECVAGSGRGGLCPGGRDRENLLPKVDPNGEPGCVYSYGQTVTVPLDRLAGIAEEDCGGVPCRDWWHFRTSCTNRAYKKKFDLGGRVVDAPFCVEYDIHPVCEPTCHAPACRRLQESGAPMELGLPFWQNRCNARANQRRMEAFAKELGMPDAGTRHLLVDNLIFDVGASCMRENRDGRCRPNGDGGPYCSRHFSGVCQPCYIPNTVNGPEPDPMAPLCPFDVLKQDSYRSRRSLRCKSRRPSDSCCLYTQTCEGESDPEKATLDSDGLALVARRMSTPDMASFLQRALAVHWAGHVDLLEAAYYEWGLGPLRRNLDAVLREITGGNMASTASLQTDGQLEPRPNLASGVPEWNAEGTVPDMGNGGTAEPLVFRKFLERPIRAPSQWHWSVRHASWVLLSAGLLSMAALLACRRRCSKGRSLQSSEGETPTSRAVHCSRSGGGLSEELRGFLAHPRLNISL